MSPFGMSKSDRERDSVMSPGPDGVSSSREKVIASCHVRLSSSSGSRWIFRPNLRERISSRSPFRVRTFRTSMVVNSLPMMSPYPSSFIVLA